MDNRYDAYWAGFLERKTLRWAVSLSLVVHLCAIVVLWWNPIRHERVTPLVFNEVSLFTAPPGAPQKTASVKPPTPKPVPPPPVEQPKPEPEPPKPEPPKEKPKPIEEAALKKVEPPKEEKKVEPPKEKPKPLKLKEAEPEPVPKPMEMRETPDAIEPMETMEPIDTAPVQSLEFSAGFPSELGTWGGLVKRKVEARWAVPSGLRIAQNEALISFWVDRDGNLIGDPEIIQHAADRAVGESGLLAVKLAGRFPPLPKTFTAPEVNVVIVFRLN